MHSPLEMLLVLAGIAEGAQFEDNVGDGVPRELLNLRKDHEVIERCRTQLSESSSLYQAALAVGLEDLLRAYLLALAAVEEHVAEDSSLTVYHVRSSLGDYIPLFSRLASLLHSVCTDDIRGGRLLEILYLGSSDGDASASLAFSRLLHATLLPFFSHLIRWMAFGDLAKDTAGDFFIVRKRSAAGAAADVDGAGRLNARVVPTAAADPASAAASSRLLCRAVAEDEWKCGFEVHEARVPSSFISSATAAAILSIGKTVRLLRVDYSGGGTGAPAAVPSFSSLFNGSRGPGDAAMMGSSYFADSHVAASPTPGVSEESRMEIAEVLSSLRIAPLFDAMAFRVVIERLKHAVHRRLWSALLDANGGLLLRHVAGLRDYLLCGRGDLFQAFLEAALPVMAAVPPTSPLAVEVLMSGPWQAALQATMPTAPGTADASSHDARPQQLQQSQQQAPASSSSPRVVIPAGEAMGRRGSSVGSLVNGSAAVGQPPQQLQSLLPQPPAAGQRVTPAGASFSRKLSGIPERKSSFAGGAPPASPPSAVAAATGRWSSGAYSPGGGGDAGAAAAPRGGAQLQLGAAGAERGDHAAATLDPFLQYCYLQLPPRAQVWTSRELPRSATDGGEAGSAKPSPSTPSGVFQQEPALPVRSSGTSGGLDIQLLQRWCPSTEMAPDAALRVQRTAASLLIVGAAGQVKLPVYDSSLGDGGAAAAPVPAVFMFLAHVGAPSPTTMSQPSRTIAAAAAAPSASVASSRIPSTSIAGAAWLPSPVPVLHGFLLRARVRLHIPRRAAPEKGLKEAPFAHTASFSIVVQRNQTLVCGENTTTDTSAAGVGGASAGPPTAGFVGIPDSLVIHILCKMLPPQAQSVSAAATAGVATSRSGAHSSNSSSSGNCTVSSSSAQQRFRIVAAAYGPPSPRSHYGDDDNDDAESIRPDHPRSSVEPHDADGRELLASGAILDCTLTRECTTIEQQEQPFPFERREHPQQQQHNGHASSAVSVSDVFPLHVCVEYVPRGGSASSSLDAASSHGQLRVVVAESTAAAASQPPTEPSPFSSGGVGAGIGFRGTSSRQGPRSVKSNSSSSGGQALSVVDPHAATVVFSVPFRLESALQCSDWRGPGRGRAWVGLTASAVSSISPATHLLSPSPGSSCGNSVAYAASAVALSPAVSLASLDALTYAEGTDGYRGMCLSYSPPWPLHVLLDASVMCIYSDISRFLLRCKAHALALQTLWKQLAEACAVLAGAPSVHSTRSTTSSLLSRAGSSSSSERGARWGIPRVSAHSAPLSASSSTYLAVEGVSAQVSGIAGRRSDDPLVLARVGNKMAAARALHPIYTLRTQMAFLVDALVFHLQVDVIATGHAAFVAAAGASRDYRALTRAHDVYMHTLVVGSFLGAPALLARVERCLGGAEAFVSLMREALSALAVRERPFTTREFGDRVCGAVAPIRDAFGADCGALCSALAHDSSGDGSSGGASRLLTRLLFNGYFA